MRSSLRIAALLATLALSAFATDFAGTWNARVPSPPGSDLWSLTPNVDGNELTGTISVRQNTLAITDGKISGDTISFAAKPVPYREYAVEWKYVGTRSGDEIKFRREGQFRSASGLSTLDVHRYWLPAQVFTARHAIFFRQLHTGG
jgi:hypothetical protein